MRQLRVVVLIVTLAALAALSTGCRTFINLFGLGEPVRMALVTQDPVALVNPFTPYDPLLTKLSAEIGQPIRIEPCFPFQAGPQLQSGWHRLAVATPAQIARFDSTEGLQVVGVPARGEDAPMRPAVLVVKRGSDIAKVSDVRGKRVSFGAQFDSRTHLAALAMLNGAGIQVADLAGANLLELPLWKQVADPRRRAQYVLDGTVDAAFIDLATWDAYPRGDQRPDEPCQSKLRAVEKTILVPDRVWLASPKMDSARLAEIQGVLLAAHANYPETLKPLNIGRFYQPREDVLGACAALSEVAARLGISAEFMGTGQ